MNTISTLANMTVNELRNRWNALMVAAKVEGLDTVALKNHAMQNAAFLECPTVSKAIYAVAALEGAIQSAGTTFAKTGRMVWETGFGGDRNLVPEFEADSSVANRVFAAVS